jgi:outer membrane protein assembly factor BamB
MRSRFVSSASCASFLLLTGSSLLGKAPQSGIPTLMQVQQASQARPLHGASFSLPFGKSVLDATKPLALADFGGWALVGDQLIGSVENQWVGAFSTDPIVNTWMMPFPPGGGLTTEPVGSGEFVYLAFRDGSLLKVRVATGKVEWTASLDSYANRKMIPAGSDRWIVATATGSLYALDSQTGKVAWSAKLGTPNELTLRGLAAPVFINNRVYVGSPEGEVLAFGTDTGDLLWKRDPCPNAPVAAHPFRDILGTMLLVQDQHLLLTRNDGFVGTLSLDGASHEAWIPISSDTHATTSYFRENRYYVGTLEGKVLAFDIEKKTQLWSHDVGYIPTSLMAGERQLYVIGTDGKIACLSLRDGSTQWTEDLEGIINPSLVYIPSHHSLYAVSPTGWFYGYRVMQ